jgi:MFS family permease
MSRISNENAVHSLEHGAVWITYRPDLPEGQVETLRDLVQGQTYILVSPYPDLPSPVMGLGVERIGILKAVYPAVWGMLQIVTGPLSDRWGRKGLIVGGMWVQAAGIFCTMAGRSFGWWLLGSVLLGVGTAMVYPALIAAVSDSSHPSWRTRSLSVYQFWRDLGYAVGALSAGIIADTLGISWAIGSVGVLTFLSGSVVAVSLKERERL